MCRPSCSAARGIPDPRPEIESLSSALHGGFQPLDPKGSPTDACLTHSFPKLFACLNTSVYSSLPLSVVSPSTVCYLQSTTVKKYWMESFRNKQFISFKLWAIVSRMMKSHSVLLGYDSCLCPVGSPVSHWGALSVISSPLWCCSAPVQVTLILLSNGPKGQEQRCWLFGNAKEKVQSASFTWQRVSS